MGKKIEEFLLLSLIVILVFFEISFAMEIIEGITPISELHKKAIILLALDSIDMVLIANLIIMVLINTHDVFIRPFGEPDRNELPT
jgi:uncharacterized protein (TIGR00645 family)